MRVSVIASLIVAVHLGVVMMVMAPGCATVQPEPQPTTVQTSGQQNLPDIPPMPPMIEPARPEPTVILPPVSSKVDVPQAPAAAGDNVYVVQRGDSLSKIAARHGVKTADIASLNNITDANKIFVGQKLLLPAYASPSQSKPSAAPAAPAAPAAAKNADGQTVYEVQRGDALSKIARRFGVSQKAIMEANGIKDANKIFVGKKLVIPAAGAPAAPAAPAEAPAAPAPAAEPAEAPAPAAPEAAPAEIVPAVEGPDPATLGCIPYHAVAGDTVDSIVSTFAVDRDTFLRLNKLAPNATLKPDQELFIPPMDQP